MNSPEKDANLVAEQQFIAETMRNITYKAIDVLSSVYLGDFGLDLCEKIDVDVDNDSDTGKILPTVGYDIENEKLVVKIEPQSIISFAEKALKDNELRDGIELTDVVRLLVGAGAARAVLAWRKMELEDASDDEKEQFRDRICEKRFLWEDAANYDDIHGTSLRIAVEKLGDDQIPAINVLRFVFGASINHLSDVLDIQVEIPNLFRPILLEKEKFREAELNTNSAIYDFETAFMLYDRSAPQLMYALSFPMNPNEELTSIFAEKL